MSVTTRPITADEFLQWPDDGFRHELIRGEVITMSLPGGRHGQIAGEIYWLITNRVKAAKLGRTYAAETGFLIERGPDTVRGADMAFVRSERLSLIKDPDKHVPFAPDLAVEVISPNDESDEVEEKVQAWRTAGTRAVWTVDPKARTVTIHRPGAEPITLTEHQKIEGGEVLPGFECRVGDFFV
ncbi:MAG: Uma2 family endonuclease [Isosphaerales bacterium]